MSLKEYLEQLYRNADEDECMSMFEMLRNLKLPSLRSRSFASNSVPPIAPLASPIFVSVPPVSFDFVYDVSGPGPITFRLAAAGAEPEIKKKPEPLPEEHIVSAIIGYRAWNAPLFVDELRSVAQDSKWTPFERFEAECNNDQCAGVDCSCGIYAFKKMDSVQADYKQEGRSKYYVWGECWLWGRILECTTGYRAQFAYPKSFVNSGAISKRMAEVFGVELLAK